MNRHFTPLWEETAKLSADLYTVTTEKKHFGQITVTRSVHKKKDTSFVTVSATHPLTDRIELKKRLTVEVKKVLENYFLRYNVTEQSKVLVVCLGNKNLTCDSLGYRVSEKLLVTSHLFKQEGLRQRFGNLCCLPCGVGGCTGIESFSVVQGTVREIKPDLVIAVDTLSCSTLSRLGGCVQLSDNGIQPGGGVGNPKKALCQTTLKIPVIAVGVPFVIYVSRILAEYGASVPLKKEDPATDLIVSPREIDFLCDDYATILADAVNQAVHRSYFG